MTNDFNMPVTPHRLELMDWAHLTVSGVEDVERFDESGVIMTTSAGTLIVTGEDLHIGKLSLEGASCMWMAASPPSPMRTLRTRQGGFFSRLFG
ncbi:MAG: YabP/YqfC family sporulation protein [Dysosmobacter sp.]